MNVSGYSRLGGGGGNTTGAYNFDNSITQRTGDGFVPAGPFLGGIHDGADAAYFPR